MRSFWITDVVSFLFKRDTRAGLYLPHLENREWLISFLTEAELEQWALVANWSGKRIDWLRLFMARFAIVPSSRALVLGWATAMAAASRFGMPEGQDAAQACLRGLVYEFRARPDQRPWSP